MDSRSRSRIEDALDAASLIDTWVHQYTRDQVECDRLIESALFLQFERIGEALRAFRDGYPDGEHVISNLHEWISLRH